MGAVNSLLRARRDAQSIAKIVRHVRHLRRRGRLREADIELRAFRCGDVIAVPDGVWRAWRGLMDEIDRLRTL